MLVGPVIFQIFQITNIQMRHFQCSQIVKQRVSCALQPKNSVVSLVSVPGTYKLKNRYNFPGCFRIQR